MRAFGGCFTEKRLANLCTEKTTLVGTVKQEINCAPVQNAESDRILTERTLQALKPKAVTKRVKNVNQLSQGYVHHGTVGATSSFDGFIVCSLRSDLESSLTDPRKLERRPSKTTEQLVFLAISFWTRSLLYSVNGSM